MYQPHLRYYGIDEGRYTDEQLAARIGPPAGHLERRVISPTCGMRGD